MEKLNLIKVNDEDTGNTFWFFVEDVCFEHSGTDILIHCHGQTIKVTQAIGNQLRNYITSFCQIIDYTTP